MDKNDIQAIKEKAIDAMKKIVRETTREAKKCLDAIEEAVIDKSDVHYATKKKITEKIEEYDTIIIHRHVNPDGDAIGSARALKLVIKESFPEKNVYTVGEDSSEYLSFLGEDDTISDSVYENALAIVVDTGNYERISDKRYKLAKEIIKIDHHQSSDDYGTINYVRSEASACANLVTGIFLSFKDVYKITKEAATYLFLGIVTDSGRFHHENVDPMCFIQAAALIDIGVDTQYIYNNLYVEEESTFRLKSYVYKKYKITENGVAYIYFPKNSSKKLKASKETLSSMINLLDGIKGSMIWVLFNEGKDDIRVRIRSRYIPVRDLAEKYRGGGHLNACGATLNNRKEIKAFLNDADSILKEFKANNKEKF